MGYGVQSFEGRGRVAYSLNTWLADGSHHGTGAAAARSFRKASYAHPHRIAQRHNHLMKSEIHRRCHIPRSGGHSVALRNPRGADTTEAYRLAGAVFVDKD